MKKITAFPMVFLVLTCFYASVSGQYNFNKQTPESKLAKAKSIVSKAVDKLGGERYRKVTTLIGKGRFSLIKDGVNVSFQKFIDVIVLPDKERTDFIESGSKTVQVNTGETGWVYEEHLEKFREQKERGIEGFKKSLRSHYDYLLRADWSEKATLSYEGRRRASLGKRNDVVKLTFKDGFEVDYEFSDDGIPTKTIYKRFDPERKEILEETRFAQFLNEDGILTPFVVDRFTNGKHTFRVNYESIRYNQKIPNAIFAKPNNLKILRKKLKL